MTQRYPAWLALSMLALGCEHDARLGFACPGPSPACLPIPAADGGSTSAQSQPDPAVDGGADASLDAGTEPLSVRLMNKAGEEILQVELACDVTCVDVRAQAIGGAPPYSYAWDDGSAAAERSLCPDSSAQYRLQVRDSSNQKPVIAELTLQRPSCSSDAGTPPVQSTCRRFKVGEYIACGNVGTSTDMPRLTAAAHALRVHSNLAAAGSMQVTGVGESCSFSELLGSFSLPTGPSEQTLCLTPSRETATLMITTTSGGSANFLTNQDSYVELCDGCN